MTPATKCVLAITWRICFPRRVEARIEPQVDPATVVRALSARFPRWTIWWGQATMRYWGMSRRRNGALIHVEAFSAQDFVRQAREIDAQNPDSAP